MKKLLAIFVSIIAISISARSQTTTELSNIINTKPISISTSNVSANNTNLFSVDLTTTGYRAIQITITGTWNATVSFQASSDNFTTVDALPVYQTTAGTWSTTTTANGTFLIPCYNYRYIRVRTTVYASGTVNSVAYGQLANAKLPDYNTSTSTVSGTVAVSTINSVAPAFGSGTRGATVQRVTIATDDVVPASQSGTWNINNVSGTVSLPTGASTLTEQQTQTTSLQLIDDIVVSQGTALGTTKNALIGGSVTTAAPSYTTGNINPLSLQTDGSLRVAVTNSTTVSGTVAATQSGNWTSRVVGNAGATLDGVIGAATAPTNMLAVGGVYNSTELTLTNGQSSAAQFDSKGRLKTVIYDAATNTRGANVNASNQLSVSVDNTVTVGSHAVTNAGTFAVQESGSQVATDNGGFTDGTTKIVNVGFIYDEVAGTALTENDNAAARINVNRALVGTIEDGTTRGRYATVTASNALKVDGSAVTQPVSWSGQTVTVTQGTAANLNVTEASGSSIATNTSNTATNTTNLPNVIGTAASAIPSRLLQIGGSDGTNARAIKVNTSGQLDIRALTTSDQITEANSASALTSLQLIDDGIVAQGTALGTTKNYLMAGSVTTAAPTYTTGNINPLSLTTSGALRVDNSGNTQPVSYATTGSGTATGALRVELANNGTGTLSTVSTVTSLTQFNGNAINLGNGTVGTGTLRAVLASDGTAISTTGYMSVKFDQTTLGTTNGVSIVAATSNSGGYTPYQIVSAASTNATNVKASAGLLYGYYIYNANASARKVMFHNTSGTPTAGASTYFPVVIPGGSAANVSFPAGIAFSSGIAFTMVTGTADNDATAVAAGDLIMALMYK